MGSWGLQFNSNNSPLLQPLLNNAFTQAFGLGPALSLSALSYQGIAGTSITLGDLAAQLNAGSVDELAGLSVSYHDYYVAIATVLRNQGDVAEATILDSLAARISSLTLDLGDVIDVTNAGPAALSSSVNVLDLIAGSAFVANGTHAITVPNLSVSVPGLANVSATATIIESPRAVCGPVGKQAHTSQVDLTVTGTLATPTVTNFVASASTAVTIHVSLASATGTLTAMDCSINPSLSGPEAVDIAVSSGLVNASVGLSLTAKTAGTGWITGLLSLVGVKISTDVTITMNAAVQSPVTAQTLQFRLPPDQVGDIKSVGGPIALPTVGITPGLSGSGLKATLSVLGIPLVQSALTPSELQTALQPVTNAVTSTLLTPTINALNTGLLTRLSDLLGIQAGGADVWIMTHPNCSTPRLRG
jgi:hypothetical protein